MWFYAAVSTAFISGIATILSKHTLKKIDPIIFYWIVLVVSTPFILILVWKDGIPSIDQLFTVGILGSVIFYTISKIIFFQTIKNAELSNIYPLVSIGPIFTLIFSMIILSEQPSAMELLGGGITLLGTYVLNISSMREGIFEPFKILFRNKLALLMLISVFIGSIVMVFDKLAINHTFPQNTSFALLIENLVIVFGFLPWIMLRKKNVFSEILDSKKLILALGVLGAAGNVLAFWALGGGDPGIVSSIFRTQVFFVLLFSYLFLKDRPKLETIIGSIIMILGLIVLKLAS
jgi:uncharacterized membrane protein